MFPALSFFKKGIVEVLLALVLLFLDYQITSILRLVLSLLFLHTNFDTIHHLYQQKWEFKGLLMKLMTVQKITNHKA